MAIIIDQIIDVITKDDKSHEFKYFIDELNYRRINHEIYKTVEKKYVKDYPTNITTIKYFKKVVDE